MSFISAESELWRELASLANECGLCLYDCEKVGYSSLKVVVDRPRGSERTTIHERPLSDERTSTVDEDSPTSSLVCSSGAEEVRPIGSLVTVEDTSRLCRRLMVYMTVEGPRFGLSSEPEIDVSSPGLFRELRLPEHFDGALGEQVKFVLRAEVSDESGEKRRTGALEGMLLEHAGGILLVEETQSGLRFRIARDAVKRANVQVEF